MRKLNFQGNFEYNNILVSRHLKYIDTSSVIKLPKDMPSLHIFRTGRNIEKYDLLKILDDQKSHFIYSEDQTFYIDYNSNYIHLTASLKGTVTCNNHPFNIDGLLDKLQVSKLVVILSIDHSDYQIFEDKKVKNLFLSSNVDVENASKKLFLTLENSRITEIVDRIKRAHDSNEMNTILLEANLTELKYVFIKQFLIITDKKLFDAIEIDAIRKLPEIISAKSQFKITPKTIADYLNITPGRVQLGCEIVFKCGLIKLINQIKLEKIAHQILNFDSNISDIMFGHGYINRSYFNQIFYEQFNCKPLDYKSFCTQ